MKKPRKPQKTAAEMGLDALQRERTVAVAKLKLLDESIRTVKRIIASQKKDQWRG